MTKDLSELDGIEPIGRPSMNALEDLAFRKAVKLAAAAQGGQ